MKFRAYNLKERKWELGYEELGGFGLVGETTFGGYLSGLSIESVEDIVFMQFIDLLDSSGKGIYTGDVICSTNLNGEKNMYKIFNGRGGFVFNMFEDDFFKPISEIYHVAGCADMQNASFLSTCEIVGNFIINPEICKK